MIENKIDKLIEAIETLTETLSKDTKKEKPAEEPAEGPAENVTIGELQSICLKLVRKDKKNKDKIVKIIADHGGELLKDIDESKLPQVKAALEAI
jgi:poly(A) polymerase Pap1